MFGTNVGAMMRASGQDRREAQAEVWDEVARLLSGGLTKSQVLAMARTRARDLREENEARQE